MKKGLQPAAVRDCIRWLRERDLLDDRAFAQAHVRDRLRFSPRSPFLLRRELGKKGVEPSLAGEVIDQVLEEDGLDATDLSVLAATGWVRKQSVQTRAALLSAPFSPEREKVRRRLYGFLSRRGFRGNEARRGLEAGEEKARELEE